MKPWILAENNYGHIKEQQYEVAVLPLGATEPHNLHLPYGTDIFEADIVGDRICAAAHQGGARSHCYQRFRLEPKPTSASFRWRSISIPPR